MKRSLLRYILLILMFATMPKVLLAQGSPLPPSLPGDVQQAPIDGGLSILALGGGVYALNKIRKKNKQA